MDQIQKKLGVSRQKWAGMRRRGMPVAEDVAGVRAWLEEHEPELAERLRPAEKIARTYAELARELGMGGADPERVLARLATRPDFPGRPGRPGKRDAHLPVEKIRSWIAQVSSSVVKVTDEEIEAVTRRIRYLELEQCEREKMLAMEQLADVDEVAQFCEQVVADAKAVLESLEDEVVALLPENVAGEVRAAIHRKVRQMRDELLWQLSRLIEGDTDETDDPADGDDSGNHDVAAASGESLPAAGSDRRGPVV